MTLRVQRGLNGLLLGSCHRRLTAVLANGNVRIGREAFLTVRGAIITEWRKNSNSSCVPPAVESKMKSYDQACRTEKLGEIRNSDNSLFSGV